MPNKPVPGITFINGLAQAALWAPLCKNAQLNVGDKTFPLKKTAFGYWTFESIDIKPGDRYRFKVDGKLLPDPASRAQPDGVHEASMAADLTDFNWTDASWQNPPMENYV